MNTKAALSILGLIFVAAVPAEAVDAELRLLINRIPGYDDVRLKYDAGWWSGYDTLEYSVSEEPGTSVAIQFLFTRGEEFQFIFGPEVKYSNSGSDEFDLTEFGAGGRVGFGWKSKSGFRLEGAARVGGTFVRSDVSYDYNGSNFVRSDDPDSGLGLQLGLVAGCGYVFREGLVCGVELGYEYRVVTLSGDSDTSATLQGDGVTFGGFVGFRF